MINKSKKYSKYIKSNINKNYNENELDYVKTHFEIGKKDAIDYINIFKSSMTGKSELNDLINSYGTLEK